MQPEITFGRNNYFVVWSDCREDYFRIYGARVTPAGVVLDSNGLMIGSADSIDQGLPVVSYNGSRFFAVWLRSWPSVMIGRFIGPDGQAAETTRIYQAEGSIHVMRIAYDGLNFLITWVEFTGDYLLKGQLVSGNGTPIGQPFLIANPVDEFSLGLCFDGTNYLVTWNNYQIWGRKIDRNGVPLGPAFRISNSSKPQSFCDVVPGANNRYLNIWCEFDDQSMFDICGNIDIPIVAIEESNNSPLSGLSLKSSIVKNAIELVGAEGEEVSIFDRAGRKIGLTRNGRFPCHHLPDGIYFIKTPNNHFKVVKIR